jgi:hypothetical protein
MRNIRRTVFAVLASASLLGGVTGAMVATMTTAAPAGVVAAPVHVAHPTAVEYGATAIEY